MYFFDYGVICVHNIKKLNNYSKIMDRYLLNQILKDVKRKMVFIGGARQVGKTTLAKHVIEKIGGCYLNWDIPEDREKILTSNLPDSKLWCFDEIHKFDRWRNFLKGLYDKFLNERQIIVTGSAKLDYYRYSGDSLQGRYHYLRLHPLSVKELNISTQEKFEKLFKLGGFPEPFLSGSEIEAKRWSAEYRKRLIEEDVRTLENVRALSSIELMATRLPALVGSTLSANSLREDLQVTHKTVTHWLEILERMYHIFRIYPFGSPKIRALKKEPKHYHFDWSLVKGEGKRFENLVACHLLKWIHYRQDVFGDEIELRYFRDTDQREVDFVVTEDHLPTLMIECKLSPTKGVSKNLRYLKRKFPDAEAIELSFAPVEPMVDKEGVRVQHALDFLNSLI